MLVALGWFATVVAALVVGEWSVPDNPDHAAPPPSALPTAVILLGVPPLLLLLAVTAVVSRLRIPAALAGTVSAAVTAVLAGVGFVYYQVLR